MTGANSGYTYFYFNDSDDNTFFAMRILSGAHLVVQPYNFDLEIFGTWHLNNNDGGEIFEIVLTFNENNISVNVSTIDIQRTYVSTIANDLLNGYDYNDTRLENIYIYSDHNQHYYIHEMNIEFRTSLASGLPFDTTGMTQIGDYRLGSSSDIFDDDGTISYLEIERNVIMSANIRHVGLKVRVDWFTLFGGTLNDLQLQINGEPVGGPNGKVLLNPDFYLVYWEDIDKELIDDEPLFEFRSTNDDYHWFVPMILADVDGDGDREWWMHSDSSLYQGLYDRESVGPLNNEFVYIFWYDNLLPPYEHEYPYYIDCIPDNVDIYETIYCVYTAPIDTLINLRIYDDSSNLVYNQPLENTGFQTGQIAFIPESIGTFNFSLFNTDNSTTIVYKTVTVNDKSYDYLIFTKPNPSRPSTFFDLYYIYNASTFNGRIEITRLSDGITYFSADIENNTGILTKIGNIPDLTIEGIYECKLSINTGTSLLLKYNYIHLVHDEHENNVYMGLRANTYEFTYFQDYYAFGIDSDIFFVGTHNFILQDVYLQVIANKITVGNSWTFEKEVPDNIKLNSGEYTVYLKLDINGTITLLDSYSFSISESGIDGEPDDEYTDLISDIPPFIKGIIGTIITLGFVFLPMIMVSQLEKIKFKVDIPPVAYAISGGMGVVICTMIGFFGVEVMFFISVVAGFSLLISYVWQKRGST